MKDYLINGIQITAYTFRKKNLNPYLILYAKNVQMC